MGQGASIVQAAYEAAQNAPPFDVSQKDVKRAKELPMEDGIWVISVVETSKYKDKLVEPNDVERSAHLRLLVVVDEAGLVVGSSIKDDRQVTAESQAIDLLKQCLFAPTGWKPRRPRYLGFQHDDFFVELPLVEVGIMKISMFTGTFEPDELPQELVQRRACTFCRRRGAPQLFDLCKECEAVYYCCETCQTEDLDHESDVHSHQQWCSKMKKYKDFADTLAVLPFNFTKETTDSQFTDRKYRDFLARHGVLNHGYWRWEHFEDDLPAFGTLPEEEHPVVLPSEGSVLDTSPEGDSVPRLHTWQDYYTWRDFSQDSPIAVLLQWPLTLYNILANHMPIDFPELKKSMEEPEPFIIHILGVEKEADLLGLFKELGFLFPQTTFHLVLVGSEISPDVHDKVVDCHKRVKVTLIRSLYHKYTGQRPHMVVGFNAGVAAYSTWCDTLKLLEKQRVPAYFTDYCQYSCECAQYAVESLKVGQVSPPAINPFRSPVRKYCEEHDMPWYSNGFIYRLMYHQ